VKKTTTTGFIDASPPRVPRQSAEMLFFGPSSSVTGGATGDQRPDAQARPTAPGHARRLHVLLPAALVCATIGAPAFAAAADTPDPTVALPLWLFWLVAVCLVSLGAGLFAQTVRTRRSLQRERLANRLIDHSPQLVCVLDPNGAMRHMNGTGRHWLRVTHPQIAGRRFDEIAELGIAEPQALALRAVIAKAVGGSVLTHELGVKRPDGVALTLELSIRAIPRTGNAAPNLLVEGRDVTMRKAAEDKLHLAAAVFEQAREGFVIADRDGRVVTVNQAFCDISGYGADELQGQRTAALGFGIGRREVRRQVRAALQTSGHWQGEVRTSRKDGSLYTCWAAVTQQRDASGAVTHYIGILNDITKFREVERNLVRLAHVDTLTDLPNRSLLADRVGQLTSVSRRDHRPFALMFMDLDQFKNINDTLGHSVGDALLGEVARRLQGSLREVDTVARLGGDEFAVLLPGADTPGAELVAAKLLERLAEPCMVQGHELSMTMSIGIAIYPSDGDDYEILSRNADTAMYRAKHEGKATWRFFAAGMQQRSARQLQLESALRRALERNEMLLHYQPQLDADGEHLVGVEALLRWRHPEFGMVSPAEFIPLAEISGQIVAIGEWVLRTAVAQLKSWMDAGVPPMVIAVNLSAVQFRHAGLPDVVMRALDDAGLPARYLELELTESVTANPAAAIAMMDALHGLGVRLSLDDFGTGYSSLSYLKRFPLHTLKIDQSFVRDIDTDPDDRAIVQAIIQMARALNLKTIAEGVETDAQHQFLRREGCDMMQGYRFCRPMDVAALEMWIATREPAPPSNVVPMIAA
jgi:diguanylate cyclase (GGDEF)-like protein/PAS domain S-box-containing protein